MEWIMEFFAHSSHHHAQASLSLSTVPVYIHSSEEVDNFAAGPNLPFYTFIGYF